MLSELSPKPMNRVSRRFGSHSRVAVQEVLELNQQLAQLS